MAMLQLNEASHQTQISLQDTNHAISNLNLVAQELQQDLQNFNQ
jgi:hypothetical protein